MSGELLEAELRPSKVYLSSIMNVGSMNNSYTSTTPLVERKKIDYCRSFSVGQGRRKFSASYFSLESLLILVFLTASLLILPLILPPLPPPPFMLLLLPICILAVLMILALMPPNVRDITRTYV